MITTIDTKQLINAFFSAERAVSEKKELLNNLNVYPVPDGDTGTNMTLTLNEIVKNLDRDKKYNMKELAGVITESSLMGGRGNSGVILSQFLGGFCSIIEKKEMIDKKTLKDAFETGTKEAYNSVSEPVEGTILTIMRSATEEIKNKIHYKDLSRILGSAIHQSQFTLKKTPDMLEKLKEAGVVDAGGAGFLYFLEGFFEAISDKKERIITATDDFSTPKLARIWEESSGIYGMGGIRMILELNYKFLKFTLNNVWWLATKAWEVIRIGKDLMSVKRAFRLIIQLSNQLKWQNIKKTNISITRLLQAWQKSPEDRYCCEAIIKNANKNPEEIKKLISDIDGKSAIVAQKGDLTKIHFHSSQEKQDIESTFSKLGKVVSTKIDDLEEQHSNFMHKKVENISKGKGGTIVLAVVNGEGFSKIYQSFENVLTIQGGKTMNPPVSDFSKTLNKIKSEKIIILPNNKNVFLAAEKASEKDPRAIKVLKTYDQAHGLTCLLNFNSKGNLDENIEMMQTGIRSTHTFSVTKSIRKTSISGKAINKGEYISIDHKGIIEKGKNLHKTILDSIEKINPNSELITLYFGSNISQDEAYKLRNTINQRFKCETQLYNGGQPHYKYIVSLE